jgi:hypothetical protein
MSMFNHYAISDAVVLVAAIWCVWQFAQNNLSFAAIGAGLFGLAAAIGTWRFGTGAVDALATVHRNVSQLGGMIGLALIASQAAILSLPKRRLRDGSILASLLIGGSILAALVWPASGPTLFIGWSAVVATAAFCLSAGPIWRRLAWAFAASLLLLATLFVLSSPFLSPGVSWHLYHIIVALWLLIIQVMLASSMRQRS